MSGPRDAEARPSDDAPESPPPAPRPGGPVDRDAGMADDASATLARWMVDHADSHTASALDRSAIEAGYRPEHVAEARRRADDRLRGSRPGTPMRATAQRAVVIAYGLVWLVLVAGLLAGRPGGGLDFTEIILAVLSVSMALALVMSLATIRSVNPDPDRPARALILLLALPTVLLVAIVGLCLPGVA